MARYVLSEGAARKLRKVLNGPMLAGRLDSASPRVVDDGDFAPPFTVQFAASLAEEESAEGAGDGTEGAWIIWLPGDELVLVDGTAIDVAEDLEAATGYPSGWYLLPDDLDLDDGGTLYLDIDGTTAEWSDTPSNSSSVFSIPIAELAVDSTTTARRVKQFVNSSLVMGGGSGGDDVAYDCDEYSISRYAGSLLDPTQSTKTNVFQIDGFGFFTKTGYQTSIGSYVAPTSTNITLDGDETTFAVLCRDGNTSSANGNSLSYRKLTFKGQGVSSPFNYEKSTSVDQSTQQTVTTHKLVNCKFYWNGELQTLADYDVSGILTGGTVYLRGTQGEPTGIDPDPDWEWSLGTSAASAPSGGKALNFKLYDFASSKPSVDYRTTFLSLEDPTTKARIQFKKPNGTASITIDASTSTPSLIVTDGTKFITLTLDDLPANESIRVHELTYTDAAGTEHTYHGLFCDDVDIPQTSQKTIVAGSGILVTEYGNTITITNTQGSGGSGGAETSGYSGTKQVVTNVTYNESTHKLEMQRETWVYEDGLLKSVTVPSELTEITTAVEETV